MYCFTVEGGKIVRNLVPRFLTFCNAGIEFFQVCWCLSETSYECYDTWFSMLGTIMILEDRTDLSGVLKIGLHPISYMILQHLRKGECGQVSPPNAEKLEETVLLHVFNLSFLASLLPTNCQLPSIEIMKDLILLSWVHYCKRSNLLNNTKLEKF